MTTLTSKLGLAIVLACVAVAVFAPKIAMHDPNEYHIELAFAAPSLDYPLGNDADGRDIFSRIIYGSRISLGIALAVTAITLVIGVAIGMFAGYMGGFWDKAFVFVSDVFLAFPGFLFAIAIAAFLMPSIANVVIILCIRGWVTFARLVRGQALSLKEREFVTAGRATGASFLRMSLKHMLPNMMGPIIVNASFGMAGVIMVESSLSFLGLGVPPTEPSWGAMLDQGTKYLLLAPHLSIYPGIAIMLVVLGFNFLGDGLRDKFAPRDR
jgi:peptide/nickel transport system permease protein